jgi:putative spermidine/putrescine transport system substrate-binding protein
MVPDVLTDQCLSRREYLMRAGALGGMMATTGCIGSSNRSGGKPDTLTLSTWGGSWQDLLIKAVVKPYQKETGINGNYTLGNAPNRLSKLIAQQNSPPADIYNLNSSGLVKGSKSGVWHDLNENLVPTLSKIPDQFKGDNWVLQIVTADTLLYNPNVFDSKPPGYSVYMNTEYKGKVGLFTLDPSVDLMLFSLYKTDGKSYKDIDKAFDMYKEVVKRMDPVYITSSEEYGKQFAQGNIVIGNYHASRAAQWNSEGKPVTSMVPQSGGTVYGSGYAIPKNIPKNSLKWAGKFIDRTLRPNSAKIIAKNMYYASPNPSVNYPGAIQEKLVMGEELKRLNLPDYAWVAKHRTEWKERVTQIINQYE